MPDIPKELRALILRSNRFLVNTLSENGLLGADDIDEANEKLLDAIDEGNIRQVSVLNILIFDLKKLEEKDYIDLVVKKLKTGLISLRNYRPRPLANEMNDPDLCWGTWTVPFDWVGDYYLVASAYCASRPVVEHWEAIADRPIVWYGATIQDITDTIQRITEGDSAAHDDEG
ncbi:MAG: hypothetical protein ACLFRP_09685 [Puniceicoccaceae bacterium]